MQQPAPVQAQPIIPTAQVLNNLGNYSTQFSDQPALANQFKVLGNELSQADQLRNQVADFY